MIKCQATTQTKAPPISLNDSASSHRRNNVHRFRTMTRVLSLSLSHFHCTHDLQGKKVFYNANSFQEEKRVCFFFNSSFPLCARIVHSFRPFVLGESFFLKISHLEYHFGHIWVLYELRAGLEAYRHIGGIDNIFYEYPLKPIGLMDRRLDIRTWGGRF